MSASTFQASMVELVGPSLRTWRAVRCVGSELSHVWHRNGLLCERMITWATRGSNLRISCTVVSDRLSSRLDTGSSMTMTFPARLGSWSRLAKKNASARVLRSPELRVLLNACCPGPASAVTGTTTLLMRRLYEHAEPPRVFVGWICSSLKPALKRPRYWLMAF